MENLKDISIWHSFHADQVRNAKWARSTRLMKEWRSRWQDTEVSVSILLQACLTQTDIVEYWREKVVDEIRGWSGNRRSDIKQGSFWKAYESFDKNVATLLSATDVSLEATDISHYQIGELDLSTRVPSLSPAKAFDLFIVDGQRPGLAQPSTEISHVRLEKSFRALSLRAIRSITESVVDKIENIDVATVACLLKVAKDALSRGIDQRVRWRTIAVTAANSLPAPAMTREHVLGFQLRTGNPPPFDPAERRVGAVWVPANFSQAPKVKHEQVFGQGNRRDFHMAVCARRGPASMRFDTQAHPSAGRSNQPAGRRRLWADIQLAKCTRASWHSDRRQVVSDFRLGGRARGLPDTVGAAIGLEKGIR